MIALPLLLALTAQAPAQMVAGYWHHASEGCVEDAHARALPRLPVGMIGLAAVGPPTLRELEDAYQLSRRPGLLFEIAQLYRAAGNDDEAEAHYRAYLKRAPFSDRYHDQAWDLAVEYEARRRAEGAAVRVARIRAEATLQPMLLVLEVFGLMDYPEDEVISR